LLEVDEVTKADVPHTIVSLETFADDTREEIKASMMSLSCKISEISKKEKEAWIGIAGIEDRAVEMVKEVELSAEEQVNNYIKFLNIGVDYLKNN